MKALLPGRYQPWHLGHQKCVEEIQKHTDSIIIGLRPMGTREDDFLTVEQRMEIIQIAVPEAVIAPVENLPFFDTVFSCNPELQEFYGKRGKQIIDLPRYGYSATEVRRRLALGLDINDLVVPGTAGLIWRFWEEYQVRHGQRTS